MFFFAVQDVLGENRDGAHIILVTRGGQDTLSLTDETRIKEFIMYYQVVYHVLSGRFKEFASCVRLV